MFNLNKPSLKPSLAQPFTAQQLNLPTNPQQKHLSVSVACNLSEVAEAQRLRYKVFAEEMGAELNQNKDVNSRGLNVEGIYVEGLDVDGLMYIAITYLCATTQLAKS